MLSELRFHDLWQRLGNDKDCSRLFVELRTAYDQPHRSYHTAAHIDDCLQQLDLARAEAERPDEVEAALWFHDAVYDPRLADNEERSAAWAVQALTDASIDPDATARIAALVLLTKHNQAPIT